MCKAVSNGDSRNPKVIHSLIPSFPPGVRGVFAKQELLSFAITSENMSFIKGFMEVP